MRPNCQYRTKLKYMNRCNRELSSSEQLPWNCLSKRHREKLHRQENDWSLLYGYFFFKYDLVQFPCDNIVLEVMFYILVYISLSILKYWPSVFNLKKQNRWRNFVGNYLKNASAKLEVLDKNMFLSSDVILISLWTHSVVLISAG